MNTAPKSKKNNIKRLHKYYSLTGFYSFVGQSLKKASLPILGFIILVVLLNQFVFDFSEFFTHITNTYAPVGILSVFFASESLLGLIPPEIFIAWSDKTASPMVYLTLLAILSYLGGIVSYFIGKMILRIPAVYNYVEVKMEKHLRNVRKWGGFLIIVGALLPIPFSMTSMAAGTINYRFRNYLLFGTLRFVRFYLFALAIFNLV
ncbi:MAG: VTT domain-containing protein [Altibacter sp.]|uniref:YqaA family protein n=1 Tax=Altibacter sp. TaxID=2024823 RepID=UPI001DFB8678|nr:VTT domain-containing protein [Altibacter sp.]MBZ0326281.1 VTT domain-containing protein [Altibacter sp.]